MRALGRGVLMKFGKVVYFGGEEDFLKFGRDIVMEDKEDILKRVEMHFRTGRAFGNR